MRLCCPICHTVIEDAPGDFPSRPFCSARCKLADLHNWLTGAYRMSTPLTPGESEDDEIEFQN